jgi:hypothetical protein
MNKLVSALITFMNFARIIFNPDKCKLNANNTTNEIISELALPDEIGTQRVMQRCNVKAVVKYLGDL